MNIDDGDDPRIQYYDSKWKCGLRTDAAAVGNEGESLKTLILIPSPRIVSGDPPIVAG
jgi:hypothetical protein